MMLANTNYNYYFGRYYYTVCFCCNKITAN